MREIAKTILSLANFAVHQKKLPEKICCCCDSNDKNPDGFNPNDILVKKLGKETARKVMMIAMNDTDVNLDNPHCIHLDATLKALIVLQELRIS